MGIIGTGVDIIEIERIDRAVSRSGRFMDIVFTAGEREYFKSRGNKPCHIAGNFAAKEAVVKSLGTGFRGMRWQDIEITRDSLGKPLTLLHGEAAAAAERAGILAIRISISHSRDYAVAVAVAEGD